MMAAAGHASISGKPATVLTIRSIEEALKNAGDNFGGLCFIIGQYQLSSTFPNTPEEAKKRIQDYIASLKSQIDSKKNELESTTRSSAPFMKKEREHQMKCEQLYEECASKLLSQKLFVKCCLELQCAGFENTLKNELNMLEDDTMRILITGEVSSGKSSVLNMLMGGNFMAVRRGHCTQVLCEVQHSPKLKAVLYYDDTSPRRVDLSKSEDDEIWEKLQNCMQTGEDFLTPDEQAVAHKLKFIRIHWKIPFMNEELYGVTFIDIPGFYDSDESFVYVNEAIKNSHAFVFVINTSQHDGVDRDRLLRLMKDVQGTIQLKYGMFSPKCGFFICNKWDGVEEGLREGLQKEIFKKLHASWPRMTERQIVPLTCSLQAVRNAHHGSYDDDYVKFRKRLIRFVEAATRLKTELSAWWLSAIVDRTVAIARNTNNLLYFARRREDILIELNEDIVKISIAKKKIAQLEKDFSEYIERKRDRLERYIASNLDKNKEIFLLRAFDFLSTESKQIDENIRIIIDEYFKTDSCVEFEVIQTNRYVEDKIISLGKMYSELENSLKIPFGGLLELPDLEDTPDKWFFRIGKNTVSKRDKENYQRTVNEYGVGTVTYMRLRIETIIKQIVTTELRKMSDASLNKTVEKFKETFEYFLKRTQVRYEMTKALSDEIETSELSNEKSEILDELSKRLQHFLINDILRTDIDPQRLSCTLQKRNCLGSGSFGSVYRGTYTENTEVTPVACKVIRMPCEFAETSEGLQFHRECVLLRMLSVKPAAQRENVVEYIGHFTEVTSLDYKLFLVFELCDSNLDSLIQKEMLTLPRTPPVSVDFPGKSEIGVTEGAWFVLDLAEQAAAGVKFLHDNNIVHRDIKPQNFLIKMLENKAVVKVCDFGASRHEDMVTTVRYVGTIPYNAPEVLAGKPNTFASDIYSLGLVIWELWFGEKVFKDLNNEQLQDPDRNPPLQKPVQSARFRLLLNYMFQKISEDRPSADKVVRILKEVKEQFRKGDY